MRRPIAGRVLGGVAVGIAEQTGLSVGLIRLGFLFAALFGGFGLVLYAAAWSLLPGEGEQDTPAERWFQRLTTHDSRLGAVLIGAAVLVLLATADRMALAAGVALIGAALLVTGRPGDVTHQIRAGSTGNEKE
jgi:phage shock protein PspC (stress-responsive transcriptional regulator)